MKSVVLIVCLFLTASVVLAAAPDAATAENVRHLLAGRYDNRDQLTKAPPLGKEPIPHFVIDIDPVADEWTLWHVHLETDPKNTYDQTWAMETRIDRDGRGALIPYYQFKQETTPTVAQFDPKNWLSLEACALRGDFGKARVQGLSEGEPCVAVTMNIGARRALLPVGFLADGEALYLDFDLRGERVRIKAERAR